jgi:hypothetical protein
VVHHVGIVGERGRLLTHARDHRSKAALTQRDRLGWIDCACIDLLLSWVRLSVSSGDNLTVD